MPVTDSPNVTFAFSERQDAWTTRYSFVPTCYANCDDQMLSFQDNKNKAWIHDKNPIRNSFYGGNSDPSLLEVSFNESPSEVKVFNSVSLETNRDLWRTKFSTNSEYDDENNQETENQNLPQELDEKEGFKYLELPKSVSNSTANVIPAPSILLSEEGVQQIQDQIEDALAEFLEIQDSYAILIDLPLDEVSYSAFLSTPFGDGVEAVGFFQGATIPLSEGMYTFNDFLSTLGNAGYYNLSGSFSLGGNLTISNIQNGVMTISIESPMVLLQGPSSEPVNVWFTALQDFLLNASGIFAVTPAEINGDSMRGPYLKALLECFTIGEPLELHSVNVDYAFSSSAARLTQNS